MASFSFRAGNAAQLMRMPLHVLGRIGTLLVPRDRTWVFASAAGVADGALALWREASADGADTIWLTGSESDAAAAAALGMRHVPKHSLRGWLATARAGVIVVTHGLGDANRYALAGGFIVQLWHGIPLKRIGLDSPVTTQVPQVPGASLLRRFVRLLYRANTHRIDLVPAASHRVRGRLESAFGLDAERVLVTGEPRVDVLSTDTPDARKAKASDLLHSLVVGVPTGARTVLYAPTWRDGAPDPAIPGAAEWMSIIALLERQNAVLLVRSHPLGAGSYAPPLPSNRVRHLPASLLADITPVLPAVDVLVTDYSSLMFDVALLGTPTLHLAPDVDEYAATRGFYGQFADVADSPAVTWHELLDRLRALLGSQSVFDEASARSRALSAQVHAFRDGRNAQRVAQAIRARIATAPKGAP